MMRSTNLENRETIGAFDRARRVFIGSRRSFFLFPRNLALARFSLHLSCFYPRGKVSCRFGLFDTTRGVARHSRSRASP
jgi:hypothetical protein